MQKAVRIDTHNLQGTALLGLKRSENRTFAV
jgi:hypothetical protein